MAGRVEGKVAFITGAARGQGRATRCGWPQEGADIIAVDICKPKIDEPDPASTPEDLAETADLVKGQNRRVVTAEVDVRDYDALKAAVDSGVEQLGRLDIVVANAGIGNGGETLDKTIEPRLAGDDRRQPDGRVEDGESRCAAIQAGGRGGSIILTSSVGGLKAYPHVRPLRRRQARCGRPDANVRGRVGPEHDPGNSVHPTNVNTPCFRTRRR